MKQRCNPTHTIIRRLCAKARAERGQSLVEFAVVLPVLILIILGITYFGRYMDYTNQMTQLAEEGARWAAVDYNPPGVPTLQSYLRSQVQGELAVGSSDVSGPLAVYIYYPTGNTQTAPAGTYNGTFNLVGNSVRVCIVATVRYPFLGTNGITSTIAKSATMRIEAPADASSFANDAIATLPSQCPSA